MDRTASSRRAAGLLAGTAAAALLSTLVPLGAASAAEPTPSAVPAATPASSPTSSPTAAPVGRELPAPRVVGPADALSPAPLTYRKHVVLDWDAVPGATGYRVEVGQDEDWAGTPSFTRDVVSTEVTLPTALPHASYLWRVSALDGGTHGAWSGGSFTRQWVDAPTPLSPSGAGTGRPTFSWTPVADASAYELQVSSSRYFADARPTETQASAKVDTCFTVHTRVTPYTSVLSTDEDNPGACVFTLLGGGEQRYWRVRALDRVVGGGPEGPTKPASSEGVSHLPPDSSAADIASACPGSQPSASPAASASASPSGSASASAAPSATATPAASGEKSETGGCAPNHVVEKGAWSAPTAFSATYPAVAEAPFETLPLVRTHPLAEDPRSAPTCPGGTCVDVPTLTWDAVPGASRYRVYVALEPTYDNIVRVVETSATEWTATDAWRDNAAGASYYYAVQPCTRAGCGAVTPAPPGFRKSSRAVVPVAVPVAPALRGAGDVALSWSSLASRLRAVQGGAADCGPLDGRVACWTPTLEAASYRVQVTDAADTHFQRPLVDEAEVDATRHIAADLAYPTGSYRWRVQAVDPSGHGLAWSAPSTFEVDATPPTAVVTGATSVTSPLVVRFSEPVRGVSATTVAVSPATATTLEPSDDGRTVVVRPVTTWLPGERYRLVLGAGLSDLAGNPLVPVVGRASVPGLVDDGSAALRYVGAWGFRTSSNAVGGGFRTSAPAPRAQTAATVVLRGKGVLLKGCVGPAGGVMDVWVDGTKRLRVDTYRSYSGCGVTLATVRLTDGVHRVQVRGIGQKRAASRGTGVSLDAVTAL